LETRESAHLRGKKVKKGRGEMSRKTILCAMTKEGMMKEIRIKLIGLAIFLTLAGAAWADHQHPIACGTTITDNATLVAADPVVAGVCPANGLIVADGVKLNLNSKRIRGDGVGAGVEIQAGPLGVTVHSVSGFATVQGFVSGVRAIGVDGSNISRINAIKNFVGIEVKGDTNTIVNNRPGNNRFTGLLVDGDKNVLVENVSEVNDVDGISVTGTANRLRKNRARLNGANGVFVAGGGNIDLGGNSGRANGGVQCQIDGVACR
jgi:hypothetical protein